MKARIKSMGGNVDTDMFKYVGQEFRIIDLNTDFGIFSIDMRHGKVMTGWAFHCLIKGCNHIKGDWEIIK